MTDNGQAPQPFEMPDPTIDRYLLLARVGEGQMRLEAALAHLEDVVRENRELRAELEQRRAEDVEADPDEVGATHA